MKNKTRLRRYQKSILLLRNRQDKGEKNLDCAIIDLQAKIKAIHAVMAVDSRPRRNGVKPKLVYDFYSSRAWLALRYKALQANDGKCELCGRSKKDGIRLHVDHIKPRSRFPAYELMLSNLQILCNECNIGKGNKCTRDWRG